MNQRFSLLEVIIKTHNIRQLVNLKIVGDVSWQGDRSKIYHERSYKIHAFHPKSKLFTFSTKFYTLEGTFCKIFQICLFSSCFLLKQWLNMEILLHNGG